ncbi:DUF4160 domain-containing protein [Pannus brasiliensis]|uniref:DUF4160 domain-containing protein n=1 Tax=Pannus brasiliensis TaxID=1579216 RepID=UPI003BEEDD80
MDAFKIDGLELFFNSHDHKPPHFHAYKRGAWEIRVFFLSCSQEKGLDFEPKWPPDPALSSKEKKQILKYVLEYRAALLIEWENKVRVRENY